MRKREAFTLIELIAVLVILAILALIVTPLVLNIVKKARVSADKRSIDAYGRSIELAVADYLLDKGTFPISIEQLQVEYTGDKVECNTTTLREDGSVYLAECTVNEREVTGYTYGKEEETPTYDAYEVGDEVTYNNVNYYVIKDSDTSESTVTLLKAEPITSTEISPYLSSTEVGSKVSTNGTYAIMAYYPGNGCTTGGKAPECNTDYSLSSVKQVVDIWKTNYAGGVIDARLIQYNELETFEYEIGQTSPSDIGLIVTGNIPSWLYNSNYRYWTMTKVDDSDYKVFVVGRDGVVSGVGIGDSYDIVVRPVIVLLKSAL